MSTGSTFVRPATPTPTLSIPHSPAIPSAPPSTPRIEGTAVDSSITPCKPHSTIFNADLAGAFKTLAHASKGKNNANEPDTFELK